MVHLLDFRAKSYDRFSGRCICSPAPARELKRLLEFPLQLAKSKEDLWYRSGWQGHIWANCVLIRENDVDKDNSTWTMIQQFVTSIPTKLGHVSASLFHINRKILKSSFQRNKRCIFWTSELRVMIVLVEGAHAAQHLRENWWDCLSSHFS